MEAPQVGSERDKPNPSSSPTPIVANFWKGNSNSQFPIPILAFPSNLWICFSDNHSTLNFSFTYIKIGGFFFGLYSLEYSFSWSYIVFSRWRLNASLVWEIFKFSNTYINICTVSLVNVNLMDCLEVRTEYDSVTSESSFLYFWLILHLKNGKLSDSIFGILKLHSIMF